jgi:predicted RecB family nuclease
VRLDGAQLILSPSDLVSFLACKHRSGLELQRAHGLLRRPYRDDPQLALLSQRGLDHERAYLARLAESGRRIWELSEPPSGDPGSLRASAMETASAMAAGHDVIYQATLFDGRWTGRADFLIRSDRPSRLGGWSYDLADAKLARNVKAAAVLQLSTYADLVEQIQGAPVQRLEVVAGDAKSHEFRRGDFSAYHAHVRRRFEAWLPATPDPQPRESTYPEPVEHCRVCPWWTMCMDRRRQDDHLSIVAGMSRGHARQLVDAGVPTLAGLAALPEGHQIATMNPRVLGRLRHQAQLQAEYRNTHTLRYELLPPEDGDRPRGLAALPEPTPLDLFFDIEADPWVLDGGLEYLLGVVASDDPDAGNWQYHALWGHDRAGEKAAFEQLIAMIVERLARAPGMHVYHYGAYETGALKRLMQRHGTCEDELDQLLRGGVFVDVYEVVRHALRASVESYSIKQIEKLCGFERSGPITRAGFSVVQYERWRAEQDPSLLDDLAAYNRDDCVSLRAVRDWLEERREEARPLFPDGVVPRPTPEPAAPPVTLAEQRALTRELVGRLTADVPADVAERTEAQQGRWLLAQLLEWHHREAKPAWWNFFRLKEASPEDLFRDGDAITGLVYEGVRGKVKKSLVHRYRFDPGQETKVAVGDTWIDPATEKSAGEVVGVDGQQGTLDLKRGANSAVPHPGSLIAPGPIDTTTMQNALRRLAASVLQSGIEGAGAHQAARDILLRQPPRLSGHPLGLPLVRPAESLADAARRIVLDLEDSALPIQGPPGTGKTWTGARMIVALVAAGKKVGICAQAHRAISNLIEGIPEAARQAGIRVRVVQKCENPADSAVAVDDVTVTTDNAVVIDGMGARDYDVAAGTTWLFSREDASGLVDVLFVDEAGQMSLANVLAIAGAARSIVLLGDPNQLPQVSQGVHPEGAEKSALEHLVGEAATVAEDRGLFLETTYRLHPRVNDFVSGLFYEDRLVPAPENQLQVLDPGALPLLERAGVCVLAVDHTGNSARSHEEAEAVVGVFERLLGCAWSDRSGTRRTLTHDDLLVVAPYNAQVSLVRQTLQARLAVDDLQVGTVDKFQGREAPVAIYSLTTSSPDDAPRDLEFLYSGNRLNVAASRARTAFILVLNPAVVDVECRTVEQMRLVNAFCHVLGRAPELELD